jgi:diketogulonate reductase-like aldo/keto reductase
LISVITFSGIIFEAYSPLGCPGRPFKESSDPIVLEDPLLKEIGEKHGVSPAQVNTIISF